VRTFVLCRFLFGQRFVEGSVGVEVPLMVVVMVVVVVRVVVVLVVVLLDELQAGSDAGHRRRGDELHQLLGQRLAVR
jgi:uncharacterized membrane protein